MPIHTFLDLPYFSLHYISPKTTPLTEVLHACLFFLKLDSANKPGIHEMINKEYKTL